MAESKKSKKAAGKETAAETMETTDAASETAEVADEGIKELTYVSEEQEAAQASAETAPIAGTTAGTGKTKKAKKEKEPKPPKPSYETKGLRFCAACDMSEAEMLQKSPRYSLCQGVDVNCYRKGHRVLYDTTEIAVRAMPELKHIPDANIMTVPTAAQKVKGLESGIKPGILVLGATKPPKLEKPKKEKAASAPVAAGQGQAGAAPVEAVKTEQTGATNAPSEA